MEARSINCAEILTARTDAVAEPAEVGARAALAPSCRKCLAAARAAWPRTPRRFPGGPCLVWGPRGIETSRQVAQQRGSERGSPGREINTDQAVYEYTALILSSKFIYMAIYPHSTISKSSPVDRDLSRSRNSNFKMKYYLKAFQQAPFI